MTESARVLIEVLAGVVPHQPEPEYTRRWVITVEEWEQVGDPSLQAALLAERTGQAQGYASLLMQQPDRFNWVRLDWLWL